MKTLAAALLVCAGIAYAQPSQSTIVDTIYTPNTATLLSGTLQISNPVVVTSVGGYTVGQWTQPIPVSVGVWMTNPSGGSTPIAYVSGGGGSGTGTCIATATGGGGTGAAGTIAITNGVPH